MFSILVFTLFFCVCIEPIRTQGIVPVMFQSRYEKKFDKIGLLGVVSPSHAAFDYEKGKSNKFELKVISRGENTTFFTIIGSIQTNEKDFLLSVDAEAKKQSVTCQYNEACMIHYNIGWDEYILNTEVFRPVVPENGTHDYPSCHLKKQKCQKTCLEILPDIINCMDICCEMFDKCCPPDEKCKAIYPC